jgi:hypothetical protein
MSSFAVDDFIREAAKQTPFYEEQIKRFEQLRLDHTQKLEELQQKCRRSLEVIARAVFPAFTKENLQSLAVAIHAPAVAKLDEALRDEQESLRQTIQRIEAMSDFQTLDALTNPTSGVLTTQLAEMKLLYVEADTEFERITSVPFFAQLLQVKYGRPNYTHQSILRFFNAEHLRNWKNGDAAVERLSMKDFGEVLSRYDDVTQQRSTFSEALNDLYKQLHKLNALADEHRTATERLKNLDAIYVQTVYNAIGDFLRNSSIAEVRQLFGANAALETEYKFYDGVQHQITYLQSVREKVVNDMGILTTKLADLATETNRYKSDKYRFRNKRWDTEKFQRKFQRDPARYDRSINRYQRTGDTIYVYNDYTSVSFANEFLWWDVMTDGRLDGNFIPEVQEYYGSHPDYSYERDTSMDVEMSSDNS